MAKKGESSQSSVSGPWPPSGKALKGILSDAGKLYDKKRGFHPYKGQGWVDFAPETEQALSSMTGIAKQGNPFYGGSADFTKSLIGGDYQLDPSGFQSLLGQGPNALQTYGTDIASGANGIGTEGDYRNLFNAVDPEFEKVVQKTAGDLTDQIGRTFGGASYGSAQHTGTIADQVGSAVSQMRSQNFNNNLQNRLGILGNISGIQGQNIGNQLSAAGALSGEQQAGLNLQRGLYGDIANLGQQDIGNRLSGLGVADSVYNSQYLPSQMLAGVGAAREGKSAEELQAKMDKAEIKDQNDWDRLMSYFGIATGTGAQGNRTTTTVQQPSNPWSSILGGGLLASQLFA